MKISNSFASTLSHLSPSQLSTTWRGRHITFAVLGTMSIVLVAFIVKRVFFSPAPESSPPATPKTPRKAPPNSTSQVASPTSLRLSQKSLISGDEEVFKNCVLPNDLYALPVVNGKFTANIVSNSENPGTDLFTNESSILYVADFPATYDNLVTTLGQQGWNNLSQTPIMDFLSQLDRIGQEGLSHLYPNASERPTPCPRDHLHGSISKNEQDQTMIVLNNLGYADSKFNYQLYVIAIQISSDKPSPTTHWDVNIHCTQWAPHATHPVKLLASELGKDIPSTVRDQLLVPPNHHCIQLGQLNSAKWTHFKEPSSNLFVCPVDDLKQVFGDNSGLKYINDFPSFMNFILSSIPHENFSQEPPEVIFQKPITFYSIEKGKAFVHVFLNVNKRVFEIGCNMTVTTEFKFFEKNHLTAVILEKGFYIEWKETSDHPLITLFSRADDVDPATQSFLM